MYDKYVKDVIDIYDKEQDEYEKLENKKLPHEKEHEEEHKIVEKYDKLLLKNNDKYNIIFRYDLLDAWGVQISTLIITSDKDNNMWCVYYHENQKDELGTEYFNVKYRDGCVEVFPCSHWNTLPENCELYTPVNEAGDDYDYINKCKYDENEQSTNKCKKVLKTCNEYNSFFHGNALYSK